MYLIELFLPLYDNSKQPFGRAAFDRVRSELTEEFGGVTAFLRAPADGIWKDEGGTVSRDDIAILEVMSEELDREWWSRYKTSLEERFRQKEMIVRATKIELL